MHTVKTFARLATAAAVVAAGALVGAPAAAQTTGCGYGTDGEFANTICWIDMSGFDQAQAMEAAGQPMSIELTPDYTMTFTFKVAPGADGYRVLKPTAFPTYGKAPIGNTVYRDTPGKPALYQQVNAGTGAAGDLGTLTIDDLVVTGPDGAAVDGYGIVMADAETTNRQEGLTFSSDKPIEELTRATMPDAQPACGQELSGIGTTSVTCKGNTAGGLPVDEIILYSVAPTTATIGFLDRTANAVQGVAFGILTAKVGMDKTVVDKTAESDSFALTIEDEHGDLIGEGSTDGGDSGTIESQTVLASVGGRDYTLAETAEGDTDLATYTQDWTCTNNGADDPSLPSGDGTSQVVKVKVGDDIRCTVTNTGTPPGPSPSPSPGPSQSGSDGPTDPGTSDDSGDGALPVTGASAMLYGTLAALALAAAVVGWLMIRRARRADDEWPSI
ncbi:CshA/CshB family fibrillar adhesin-related protein [Glycomyces tritici]|uniref:CshA/CshB family fibrillar adhesin-related protein n=1 Tax=Glycomyces tritici TaxID=2665176 RepID=A0ABT7YK61_9ACTN|nr:CshA/CshB family fibrillar adhesin-related protein [Glycomyces tritici]MDN3239021.1 CshA/CshB family fibrillar adhesin-related protein [Glycomyces tritici]MDN3240183.1 CshA/CshB family fibrillar adhesin-related protein [Glycomyces tritici]